MAKKDSTTVNIATDEHGDGYLVLADTVESAEFVGKIDGKVEVEPLPGGSFKLSVSGATINSQVPVEYTVKS